MRSDVSRTTVWAVGDQTIWWSQTGSNRRPHACKARALPAELWPRNQKTNAHSMSVVGLGRLELPTSRLSSARSNQLSYKPIARIISRSRTLRRPCLQPALQAGALMPKQPVPYGTSASTQSLSMKEEKRRRRYPAFLSRSSCSEEAGDNLHKANCKWPSLERR